MQHPFYLIALALVFIFSFVLGIFTILLNPRSRVHQLWFLTTMGVAIWSGGLFTFIWNIPDKIIGLWCTIILHIGSTALLIFFFHFVLFFLFKTDKYKKYLIVGYILALFFTVVLFIPGWFIKEIAPRGGFEIWVAGGNLYYLYILYFVFYVIFSIRLLYLDYITSDGVRKKQILYILLAAIIGFGGGMTNFLPQLLNIAPFGTFVIFFYPILITYGIFFPEVKIKFR